MECVHNVKPVKGKNGGVRGSILMGSPYFSMDFGMEDGCAHAMEEEWDILDNFAPGNFYYCLVYYLKEAINDGKLFL